jgi:hypothetical protein
MPTNLRVIGALALALLFTACATTAPTVPAKTDKSNVTASAVHTCTGSRIPYSTCVDEIRTYSSTDLNGTGITPSSDGLQLLNPSLIIQH